MVTKVSDTVVNTQMEGQFRKLNTTSGLNFVMSGGYFAEEAANGGQLTFPEQTLTLTDNATNWIYFDFANTPATLEVSTTKPDEDIMLLHQVVTVAGAITSHVDYRWKTPFNRYTQPAFWPSNESELIWFKHKNSTGADNFNIVRGLGTPYQRWLQVVELKAPDLRISSDDSTTGVNAYGFWRTMSPDNARMVQQRNVNGTTAVPFQPFKRDTGALNSDVDWVALATPPQMIDNASSPVTSQLHYTEYNPVYPEVIVSGTSWWVYDDNEDDTYSVNRPVDSFDIQPLGNAQRSFRGASFSADGEWFCTSYTGGNSIQFYARSSTGARYQQTNTITTLDSSYNGALIWWDEANSEFIAKTAGTEFERLAGFAYNSGSGDWELAWEEDATTNPDYDTTDGADASTESLWISPTGDYLVILSRATLAYGMNGFTRRVGGGWDWDPTFTLLDKDDVSLRTAGEDWSGLIPLTGNYHLLVNYSGGTDHPDRIYQYNGSGSFQHIMDIGPSSNPSDFSQWSGPTSPAGVLCVTKVGTLTDPADAILNKYRPYHVWKPTASIGQDTFDYRKLVSGYGVSGNPTGYRTIQLRNNRSPANGTWNNGAGPLANTFAVQLVSGGADLEGYNYDDDDFLSNTTTTDALDGQQGSIVVVWKTPTSWPVLSQLDSAQLCLVNFGNAAILSIQPCMGLGIQVESAGTVAYPKVWHGIDNGTQEATLRKGTTALSLDTWYVWVLTADKTRGVNSLHINGLEETLTSPYTPYRWHFGYYAHLMQTMTATKTVQVMGTSPGVAEIPGAWIHAIAVYLDPLDDTAISTITNEYGV